MKWTIGRKLFLGYGLIILFIIIFSFFITVEMLGIKNNIDEFNKHKTMMKEVLELELHTANIWQFMTDASLTKDGKSVEEANAQMKEAYGDMEILAKNNKDDAEFIKKIETIKNDVNKLWDTGNRMFESYVSSQEKGSLIMPELDKAGSYLADELKSLAEAIVSETATFYEQMQSNVKRIITATIIVSIFIILISIAIVLIITPHITNPLTMITGISEKIAGGDLTADVPDIKRADELGVLAKAFAVMTKNLREINGNITESVNILASSSSQISTATAQLASGSVETATAVSQTVTSVEEVKQTSHVSNQKAKYVADNAQKTLQISHEGKKSVEDTASKMNAIKAQMNTITESIVRLSDQSRAIGEIIAAVNGIADQSNLLAVNAAIEAAKAGEQGKGFAVVAQEIKYLADQSKQSTVQVRTILDDIQKAITSVATAAEQGSRAVESGAQQSSLTSESINKLAESIGESAQAAVQIAASAQQQLVGMDQIASAMENIKLATDQSAASTKQVEVGAQAIYGLGQKLKKLTEQFKL